MNKINKIIIKFIFNYDNMFRQTVFIKSSRFLIKCQRQPIFMRQPCDGHVMKQQYIVRAREISARH